MIWLTQLEIDSSYVVVHPAGVRHHGHGMALVFVPLGNTALTGVSDHDAGVASAMVNTTQQVGGSLGVALLNTVFTTALASYIVANGPDVGAARRRARVQRGVHRECGAAWRGDRCRPRPDPQHQAAGCFAD